jgi:hypothetical protein
MARVCGRQRVSNIDRAETNRSSFLFLSFSSASSKKNSAAFVRHLVCYSGCWLPPPPLLLAPRRQVACIWTRKDPLPHRWQRRAIKPNDINYMTNSNHALMWTPLCWTNSVGPLYQLLLWVEVYYQVLGSHTFNSSLFENSSKICIIIPILSSWNQL